MKSTIAEQENTLAKRALRWFSMASFPVPRGWHRVCNPGEQPPQCLFYLQFRVPLFPGGHYRLGSIPNLRFMQLLMEQARQTTINGTFTSFKETFLAGYTPVRQEVRDAQRRNWLEARALERR